MGIREGEENDEGIWKEEELKRKDAAECARRGRPCSTTEEEAERRHSKHEGDK